MRADVTIFHHEKYREMLCTCSDNALFVAKGVIGHMTKIIRGLLAGTLPIARGELTPMSIPQRY